MIYPALDILMDKVDCKYTLAVLAAKRAREIMSEDRPLIESRSNKLVTIALEEIAQDKISYQRAKTGIK